MEGISLTCPEVVINSDGENRVSVSTQTADESELVQLSIPLSELLNRVEAFTNFKRCQIDVSNQIEFCHHTSSDTSCARTDAAYVRRSPHQVHNATGPTPRTLPPMEQLKHDLHPSASPWVRTSIIRGGHTARGVLGLTERLENLEQYTHLYDGGTAPRDLVQRVHNLESRLLQLEGRSQEYDRHMPSPNALKKVPSNGPRPRKPVPPLHIT